jgi:Cu(I)/Ag(I) efflux system membrane protein CusA/SilA
MMTVAAAAMGLTHLMWSMSAGADVMKRTATPMIGGLVTSLSMELLVYPAISRLWKKRELAPATTPVQGDIAGHIEG